MDNTPDPFDPGVLRLNDAISEGMPTKRLLTTVPVRKPGRQEFVRVRPGAEWRLTPAAILELREDREAYLVRPHLAPLLANEIFVTAIHVAMSRQGTLFLWPIRLPVADGRFRDWHRSALEGVELAMGKWIRVTANMNLGAYEFSVALNGLPEPEWPDVTFPEILRIAFRDRIIDSEDHVVIRRLRGLC
jgi:hypothetical protein